MVIRQKVVVAWTKVVVIDKNGGNGMVFRC